MRMPDASRSFGVMDAPKSCARIVVMIAVAAVLVRCARQPKIGGNRCDRQLTVLLPVCSASTRIDHLRKAPASVRFLSIEPLLEDLGRIDLTGIHWVIVGG